MGKGAATAGSSSQAAILVLVNVWDAASARTVSALPGCRAIATGSWPIAASLGVPNREVLTRSDMLAVVARIVDAVDLPVTADLESGYGTDPGEVSETVAQAVAVGVVGCNLEDRHRPLEEAARRIAAARGRADAEGVPLVINARLDLPFRVDSDVEEATRRARAYLDAGADCVFPIRARGADLLRRLVEHIPAPVNAFGVPAARPSTSWQISAWHGSALGRAPSAWHSPRWAESEPRCSAAAT